MGWGDHVEDDEALYWDGASDNPPEGSDAYNERELERWEQARDDEEYEDCLRLVEEDFLRQAPPEEPNSSRESKQPRQHAVTSSNGNSGCTAMLAVMIPASLTVARFVCECLLAEC